MRDAWSIIAPRVRPRPGRIMLEVQGKTATVTGDGSSIGLGIAKALAGAWINLVLNDLQPDRLAAARQDIEALGARAVGVTVDVSDAASVAAAGRAGLRKAASRGEQRRAGDARHTCRGRQPL